MLEVFLSTANALPLVEDSFKLDDGRDFVFTTLAAMESVAPAASIYI